MSFFFVDFLVEIKSSCDPTSRTTKITELKKPLVIPESFLKTGLNLFLSSFNQLSGQLVKLKSDDLVSFDTLVKNIVLLAGMGCHQVQQTLRPLKKKKWEFSELLIQMN